MNKQTKQTNQTKLINRQNKLYTELTGTFDDQKQFNLLNKLLETEIELEKECNQ